MTVTLLGIRIFSSLVQDENAEPSTITTGKGAASSAPRYVSGIVMFTYSEEETDLFLTTEYQPEPFVKLSNGCQ